MTETFTENGIKLYSNRAISIATYFGGPIAAGILVRRNFINLGNEKYGKYSLYIGIISTILLFIGIYSIPENIIDKIPNAIIPLIYTAAIWAIVRKLQGEELKKHKENNGKFYSAWKAVGIGAIYMGVIVAFLLILSLFYAGGLDSLSYSLKMEKFSKNEEKALQVYPLFETGKMTEAHSFIINNGIPLWKENLEIVSEFDRKGDLEGDIKILNKKMIEYCQLRIEAYTLYSKTIELDSAAYEKRLAEIDKRIEAILNSIE